MQGSRMSILGSLLKDEPDLRKVRVSYWSFKGSLQSSKVNLFGLRVSLHCSKMSLHGSMVSLNGSRLRLHAIRVSLHESRVIFLAQGEPFNKNKKIQSWGYIPHIVQTMSNIDTKKICDKIKCKK